MTEAELLSTVRDACRWGGLLTFHAFDSRRSEPGFPDLVIVGSDGLLFRELKTDRGRLTRAQQTWLDTLYRTGADATVWRPVDWPTRILTELAGIGGRGLAAAERRAS